MAVLIHNGGWIRIVAIFATGKMQWLPFMEIGIVNPRFIHAFAIVKAILKGMELAQIE